MQFKNIISQVNSKDSASIDGIITAIYECISFPPGGQPDYDRFRSLFLPNCRLIPVSTADSSRIEILDMESFINRSMVFVQTGEFAEKGFYEKEVSRSADSYLNVAQIFSTYETRYSKSHTAVLSRGINSLQLVKDGKRWWVVTMIWIDEKKDNLLPAKYLPGGKKNSI